MKVLFVVSECIPFASTGGLAEVGFSLPRALQKLGIEISVIMPKYQMIANEFMQDCKLVKDFDIKLGWRKQGCKLYRYHYLGINYYFIDNEYYFQRENLYSYEDDGERFAFFSLSVYELLVNKVLDYHIIHCHDHHSALLATYLSIFQKNNYQVVYTIHNLAYQGQYSLSFFNDVLNIDDKYLPIFQYHDHLNLTKAAIITSNLITTVSPRYAKELKHQYFAYGLAPIINQYQDKMIGILNGIDYDYYNSVNDPNIPYNYHVDTIYLKEKNKLHLQNKLGLPISKRPLIAIISRLVNHKGIDLVIDKINDILNLDVQMVIMGSGEYQHFFDNFQHLNFRFINKFDAILSKQIYAASDFILMPSRYEPCGLSQMIACRYGTIPIVRRTGGLADSINDFNGYVFKRYQSDEMYKKVKEAINDYDNNKIIQKIKKAYLSDFSWNHSAFSYLKAYRSLI